MKTIFTRRWIEIAKWSSSGGNLQPWQIQLILDDPIDEEIDDIKLKITVDKNAWLEQSPLDVLGSATVISLGCLTTNLKHIALADSYVCHYELKEVPDNFFETEVNLLFKKDCQYKTTTTSNINLVLSRHTDRYPYRRKKIPTELINEFNLLSKEFLPLKMFWIKNKSRFFKHFFQVERLRWKRDDYVDSLLSEISFDLDINKYKDKIPVGQLGLSAIEKLVFKAFKKFKFLRRLFQRHFSAFLAFKSLLNYKYFSDRIYIIQTNDFSATQIFELGLYLQELWLLAEKYKMGFQPLGSTFVFAKENINIDNEEKMIVFKATKKIKEEFEVDLSQLSLGFRIGYPSKKPARSPRKDLDDILSIRKVQFHNDIYAVKKTKKNYQSEQKPSLS